jgi:hypothetical protein
MNAETNPAKLNQILTKKYDLGKISKKVDDFDKFATKMDNFVEK